MTLKTCRACINIKKDLGLHKRTIKYINYLAEQRRVTLNSLYEMLETPDRLNECRRLINETLGREHDRRN